MCMWICAHAPLFFCVCRLCVVYRVGLVGRVCPVCRVCVFVCVRACTFDTCVLGWLCAWVLVVGSSLVAIRAEIPRL